MAASSSRSLTASTMLRDSNQTQYDAGQSRSSRSGSDDEDEAAEAKRRRVQVGDENAARNSVYPVNVALSVFHGWSVYAASM